MKPRLVDAAQDRLASPSAGPQTALDAALTEEDVLRVLARIARTGEALLHRSLPSGWLPNSTARRPREAEPGNRCSKAASGRTTAG